MSRSSFYSPPSQKQVLGWVLYFIFMAVSVWATAKSVERSFSWPPVVAYALGFVLAAAAAAMLAVVKEGLENRRTPMVIGGGLLFLVFWALILITNAHSFFFEGNIEKIRKQELADVKREIELVSKNTQTVLNNAKEEYKKRVTLLITNLEQQITDDGNPGLGPKSNEIILELEKILQTSITRLKAANSSRASVQDLAQRQSRLIYGLLNDRLTDIDIPMDQVKTYFDETDEDEVVIAEIIDCIENYDLKTEAEIKRTLRKGFAYFDKTYKYITQVFQLPILEYARTEENINITQLPESPESIEIEYIGTVWHYVGSHPEYEFELLISFLIAFVIDLATFAVLYAMALRSDDDNFD